MPLNLNPYEGQGLAALAGNRVGDLNLKAPDFGQFGRNYAQSLLGEQGIQAEYARLAQANQLAYAQMNNQTVQKQFQAYIDMQKQQQQQGFEAQQNEMNRQATLQQNQISNALRAQEIGNTAAYNQGHLGELDARTQALMANAQVNAQNKQAELAQAQDHFNQDMQFKKQTLALQQLKDQKQEDLNHYGAGISGLIAVLNSVDPKDRDQAFNSYMKDEQDYHDLSDKQIQAWTNLYYKDRDGFLNQYLPNQLKITGMASDAKNNPLISQKLDQHAQQNATTAESVINGNIQEMSTLKDLYGKLDPSILTGPGQLQAGIHALADWTGSPNIVNDIASNIPLLNYDPQKAEELNQQKATIAQTLSKMTINEMMNQKKMGRMNPAMMKLYQSYTPQATDDNTTFVTKVQNYMALKDQENQGYASLLPKDQAQKLLDTSNNLVSGFSNLKMGQSQTQSSSNPNSDTVTINGKNYSMKAIQEHNPKLTIDEIKQQIEQMNGGNQ